MSQGRGEHGDRDLVRQYLDEIGRYPLLTKDDEVDLGKRIEAGRVASGQLAESQSLTPAQTRRLRRAERDGEQAVEQFTNSNLRLVVSVAKKYQSAEVPLLDLVQDGNLGLIHAVEKFDWRKGFKFSTYATWWIRQAIGRGIDNGSRTIRLPVHAGDQLRRLLRTKTQMEGELGRVPSTPELAEYMAMPEQQVADLLSWAIEPVSLESPIGTDGETELYELVSDSSSPSPFEAVAKSMLGTDVDRLLNRLDDRESQILRLRYGLDRGEPRTLEEVGRVLNLTRERIRQIERSALSKLRHPPADNGARDLLVS